MADLIGRGTLKRWAYREGARKEPELVVDVALANEIIRAEQRLRRQSAAADAKVEEYRRQAAELLAKMLPDCRPGWSAADGEVITTGPTGRCVWRPHKSKKGHVVLERQGEYKTLPLTDAGLALAAAGCPAEEMVHLLTLLVG